jgi:tetratricopeptide (TPR) repeat protein
MSAGKGGDLGWFPKGQMVKEFDTAAFSQQVGVVGEPVKTQFGYHLVLVEERKRDLPKDFEKRKEDYRRSVAEQRVGEAWANFVRQARAAAKVEVKDPIVLAVRSMMEDPTGEKAIAYFKQAIAKGSGLPDQTRAALHYLLGNLLTGRKKYEEAAKQYEKALDLAPTPKEEVMLSLADTYQRLKQPDKAIQFVRAATDEAPDNMVASRRAENIYNTLGRKDLAEAEKKRREAIEQQAAKEAKAESAAQAKPGAKPEAKAETQPVPNSPQPAPPAAKPPAR